DAHAEDLFGRFSGLIGRAGKLDATGLAALARRHLRFDHAGTDIRSRHRHLRGGDTEHAARNRNAGRRQNQRFRRVFFEVHGGAVVSAKAGTHTSHPPDKLWNVVPGPCGARPGRPRKNFAPTMITSRISSSKRRTRLPRSACLPEWW